MKIVRYSEDNKSEWDKFVSQSKNGTFLFFRDYMGYHADRFDDHSLLFYDEKDQLLALFPANQRGTRLDSHGGLTYGGFVTNKSMKLSKMLDCFTTLINYSKNAEFETIRYKTIPHVYHQVPAQEDLYVLQLCAADCISRSVITAIDTRQLVNFQSRRKRQVKKAMKSGIEVRQSDEFDAYWQILSELLEAVHDTSPVHSLDEISHLKNLFSENIKLYTAYNQQEMLAGIVVYESVRVARTQYIAANLKGRDLGALDLLFDYLIHDVYKDKPYIEFGTSERVDSTMNYVNGGLIDQKEGFGARTIIQDQYLINLHTVSTANLDEAYT